MYISILINSLILMKPEAQKYLTSIDKGGYNATSNATQETVDLF